MRWVCGLQDAYSRCDLVLCSPARVDAGSLTSRPSRGAAAPRRERDCRTIEISRSHTAGWADRSPSDVAYAVRRTQRSMTGRQRAAARQLQLGCRVGSQIECSAYDRVHTYTPRREYVLCKRKAGRDRGDLSRLTVMDASATLVAVWPHVQDHECAGGLPRACVCACHSASPLCMVRDESTWVGGEIWNEIPAIAEQESRPWSSSLKLKRRGLSSPGWQDLGMRDAQRRRSVRHSSVGSQGSRARESLVGLAWSAERAGWLRVKKGIAALGTTLRTRLFGRRQQDFPPAPCPRDGLAGLICTCDHQRIAALTRR